jgi:hypothetical protein
MPTKLHDFVIVSGEKPHSTSLTLYGVEVMGVTRLTFDLDASDVFPRLILEFVPGTIRVTAKGTLEINGREL